MTTLYPTYSLTLERTYYNQGFFNIPVDYDRYVRQTDGPVTLILPTGEQINALVNRRANQNGTARIMGRVPLRDWFQGNFTVRDKVNVVFQSPVTIRLQ